MRAATRLSALGIAMAAALCAAGTASAAPAPSPASPLPPKFTAPAYVMGSPNAKVTITEYASVACPHCARFDADVFPTLKTKYIDTGKVRFELREMLVGDEGMVQVAAAGFLLARCAGQARYFNVVEETYRAQPEIFASSDPRAVFVRIAKENGLNPQQLEACISDKASIDALNARVKYAENVAKVDGTPDFFIDGKKLDEHGREPDVALFDAALKPLLAAPPHGAHR